MKFKHMMMTGAAALASTMLAACTAMPVYAYSGEDSDATSTVMARSAVAEVKDASAEETEDSSAGMNETGDDSASEVSDKMDVEWDISADGSNQERILTPTGNLTLVDDVDAGDAAAKELSYMTVQTKGGNTFYLIVDRSSDEDNVYFLNMVDEEDLMALMDEDTQEKFAEASAAVKEPASTVVTATEQESTDEAGMEQVEEKQEKKAGNNTIPILLVFLAIGGVGVALYYKLKILPSKQKPEVDEDMEFEDDEDYVNEDELEAEKAEAVDMEPENAADDADAEAAETIQNEGNAENTENTGGSDNA